MKSSKRIVAATDYTARGVVGRILIDAEPGTLATPILCDKLIPMFDRAQTRWHVFAGRLLGKMGCYHCASRQFKSALAIFPRHLVAQCLLGWSLERLQRHTEALSAFDQALQIAPDSPFAHLYKGRSWACLGKYQDAADSLNRAFRIQPKFASNPRYLETLAQCYWHLNQIEKALEVYSTAERLDSKGGEFVYRVGLALTKLERYSDAEQPLRRAISLNPSNANARYNLGVTLYNLKRYQESIEMYRTVVSLSPGRADAHIAIGIVNKDQGCFPEAEAEFKEALRVEPENSEPYLQLSVLYADNGEWQKALDASRRLVELRPNAEVSYLAMAGACQELKLYKEQIEACNQALRINPDSLPSLEGLAWALYHTEKYDDAVSVLTRAVKMSPSVPYFHAWLAHAYAELGNLQEAAREQAVLQKLDHQLAADVEKTIQEKMGTDDISRPT